MALVDGFETNIQQFAGTPIRRTQELWDVSGLEASILRQMHMEDAEEVQCKDAREMKLVGDTARDVDRAFGLVRASLLRPQL